MAATEEMLAIALKAKPHACCIVPEKREDAPPKAGIDVVGQFSRLEPIVKQLVDAGIRVSMSSNPTASSWTPAGRSARRWWNCIPAPMPMPPARRAPKLLRHIHNGRGNSRRSWA